MKKIIIFIVFIVSSINMVSAQSNEPYLVKRFDKKPEIVDGIQFGEYAYFKAETKTKTKQCIYITSGDSNSTHILDSSSVFAEFFNFEIHDENLYYGCKKNTGCYLMRANKINNKIDSIPTALIPCFLTSFNDKLYYVGVQPNNLFNYMTLFEYDEKTEKSKPLFKSKQIIMGVFIQKLLVFDNKLFFVALDTSLGISWGQSNQLYCYNPVIDSVVKLTKNKDYSNCGNQGPNLSFYAEFDNHLYFNSYDSLSGFEMFVTDGTTAGTHLFKDINDGYPCKGFPVFGATNFCKFRDELFFLGYDTLNGTQLWKTDGINTNLFKKIDTSKYHKNYRFQGFKELLANKTSLFITATKQDLYYHDDLYVIKQDTVYHIDKFNYLDAGDIEHLYMYHDKLYFYYGVDGFNKNLWVTDGTNEGTHKILAANTKNSCPIEFLSSSYDSRNDNRFFSYNGSLYFEANYDGLSWGLYKLEDTTIIPTPDIKLLLSEEELRCYPNPTKDDVVFEFNLKQAQNCKLEITDYSGKLISISSIDGVEGFNTQKIQLTNFSKGIYMARLISSEKHQPKKIEILK